MPDLNFDKALRPSKHVRNTWMRKWEWDMHDLRMALREACRIDKVGRSKYEVYTRFGARTGKSRKLVVIDYPEEVFIITGAEGSY
jgi:hypothetical protein